MLNIRPIDPNPPAGAERADAHASSATPSGRPPSSASRNAPLPPIVIVGTSGPTDPTQASTQNALVPGGCGEGALVPLAAGRVPISETSPRQDQRAGHWRMSGTVVNEEDEDTPGTVTAERPGPPPQVQAPSSSQDRSLVPCAVVSSAGNSAPTRLEEMELVRSPASGALSVARRTHVCPTCGQPLKDFDGLNFMADLSGNDGEDEDGLMYSVVPGSGRRWGLRRRVPAIESGSQSHPRGSVIQTYPGIKAVSEAAARSTTPSAVSGSEGSVLHRTPKMSPATPRAHAQDVVQREASRPRVRGLTPQYFRALALPPALPSTLLTIADAATPRTSADIAPAITALGDGAGSSSRDDIDAYVSPTGRHWPRGAGFPVLTAPATASNRALATTAASSSSQAYPPSVGHPTQSRPVPASSSPAATTVPTPPLASAPAPTESYYGRYFVEMAKLGSGAFGGVYLCQHVMGGVSLGLFALKKIPVGDAVSYLQSVLREVRILEEVKRHPNVVEYSHSWVEEAQLADFGPPVRCLFILMEYATEGSLDAYLDRCGAPLSTVAVWYFFLSAVAGTAHLHSKGVLHRDLKPQNLLLTSSGDGRPPRVLVSDFGTAALLDDVGYERTGGTGTIEYMAPELLERDARVATETYVNGHTKASDMWSLGMILYYLAFDGTLPPAREDGSPDLRGLPDCGSVQRPPEMVELIRAMLQRDPSRRPSCHDIMRSTVAQTIIRAFNHPNRTDADIFEPTSAFCNDGGRERQPYTAAAQTEEEAFSVNEEGDGETDGGRDRGRRTTHDDDDGRTPLDASSTVSSRRSSAERGSGSSRVELLSMTSTMPLGYLESRLQRAPSSLHTRTAADARAGMPPLLAHYHSNDVRCTSMVPSTADTGDASPQRSHRGVTPPSVSQKAVEAGKRVRQSSFSRTFASSPPPERKRRTADAAVQTDPVTILDAP